MTYLKSATFIYENGSKKVYKRLHKRNATAIYEISNFFESGSYCIDQNNHLREMKVVSRR